MQNNVNKTHLNVRALCEGAILIAIAQILGYIKLFPMWPNGGSITLAAFPIALYAVRWGLGRGLLAGFIFGILQLFLDEAYAWGWQSMILDYLVAYTPLGLAGLFKGKSWGIFPGILLGNFGRFIVHYVSGVTIYRIYEPTEIPGIGTFDGAELYSLVYNGSYMLPCALLALIVAALLYVPMKRYFAGSDLRQ
ncbi:MAG: proton-coupled thiamine transporter YuaJ [Ruminococcaceae bacterium]|nr:proton-coupled thiamine transporter YuaJ [Oscillospiraceae bacterium]